MRYSLIGDSHTQVIFPNLIPLLEQSGNEVVLSKPKAGWTLEKHINNNLEEELINSNPDVVVFSLGGNNRNLTKTYIETVKKGIKIARNSGAKDIYWISPMFSLDEEVEKRHKWTHIQLMNKLPLYLVKYINVRPLTQDGFQSDKVHFINSKYKELANYIYKKLPKGFLIPNAIKPILFGGIGYYIFTLISKRKGKK